MLQRLANDAGPDREAINKLGSSAGNPAMQADGSWCSQLDTNPSIIRRNNYMYTDMKLYHVEQRNKQME